MDTGFRIRSRANGICVMHHFAYRNGVLHAEAVNLDTLAAAVGTPFYCYSTATLERHYQVFAGAFADVPALVCYAMKANSNQAVIRTLACWAPAPTWCRKASRRARRRHPRRQDHVLGWQDRARIGAGDRRRYPLHQCRGPSRAGTAVDDRGREGRSAHISVRVNPDIDAKTHHKIATGKARTSSASRSAARARSTRTQPN